MFIEDRRAKRATTDCTRPRRRGVLRELACLALLLSVGLGGCGDNHEGGSAPVESSTELKYPVGSRVQPVSLAVSEDPTAADDPMPPTAYLQIPDQEFFWVNSGPGDGTTPTWYNAVGGPGQEIVGPHQALTHPYTNASAEDFLELAAGRVVNSAADQVFSMTKTGTSADNNCDLVTYRVEGQINPKFSDQPIPAYEFEDLGAYPGACVAARDRWEESPFAIAIGDLDWDGTGGELHDEVVLVTEAGDAAANPPGFPLVTVLDYAQEPGSVVPTHLRLDTGLTYPNAKGGDVGLGRVRAVVYNPDALATPRQEYIAVLQTAPGGLALSLLQYIDGALSTVGQPVTIPPVKTTTLLSTPIDLAAGDFDGDGNEELAVAYIDRRSDTSSELYAVHLHIFSGISLTETASQEFTTSLPSDKNQDQLSPDCSPHCSTLNSNYKFLHADLRLAPGVYELEAQGGVSPTKEQIAVGVVHLPDTSSVKPILRVMLVDLAATPSHAINTVTQAASIIIPEYAASGATILNYKFDMKGVYLHGADPNMTSPLASLMLSYFNFYGDSELHPTLDTRMLENGVFPAGDISVNPFVIGVPYTGNPPNPPSTLNSRLVGYDDDGDSILLGPPTVFSMDSITQVVAVAQNPPMHLDFLPRSGSGNKQDNGLVNVSADDAFYVKVGTAGSASMGVTSEQSNSQATNNIVSGSTSVDNRIGTRGENEMSEFMFATEQEQAYEGTKKKSSEATQQSSYDMEIEPGYDDCLATLITKGEIWRYQVIGAQYANPDPSFPPPNFYRDIFVPLCPDGSYLSSTNQCNPQTINPCSLGKDTDGFQPIHENLNVLSYPKYNAGQAAMFSPPDLGGWKTPAQCDGATSVEPNGVCEGWPTDGLPCTTQDDCVPFLGTNVSCVTKQTLSLPNLEFPVGQAGSDAVITLSSDATCSSSQETSNSFKSDNSVSLENSVHLTVPFDRIESTSEFGVQNQDDFTWSQLTNNTATISREMQITLSTPKTYDATFSYTYAPKLYTASNGALNFSFATDTSTTFSGWTNTDPAQGYYNPDPALNLPYKWTGSQDEWSAATDFTKNKMRGFFLGDPGDIIEPNTGLGRLLADLPTWGQKVQLQARVYNYSVGSNVSAFTVRFDIADVDDAQQDIIPGSRRVLGTATAVYTDEARYPEGPPRSLEDVAQGAGGGAIFPPRGVGRATYTLDTSCIPVSAADRSCVPAPPGIANLRIFVVIDPDNELKGGDGVTPVGDNETHRWRSKEVALIPNPGGAGQAIRVKVLNDSGNLVTTIEVKSQSSTDQDARCLAAALTSPVGKFTYPTYPLAVNDQCNITMSGQVLSTSFNLEAVYEDLGGVRRAALSTANEDDSRLPDSTDTRPGVLAFVNPVNGVRSLYFSADTVTVSTENLLIGQNNEGWAKLSLTSPTSGAAAVAGPATGSGFDLFMKTDSLGGYDLDGRFETETLTTQLGKATPIRVCGHSEPIYPHYARVRVYVRHPDEGGEFIANLQLPGINGDEGSCTWFTWTPKELGKYTLYALLAENRGDKVPTSNLEELPVEVLE